MVKTLQSTTRILDLSGTGPVVRLVPVAAPVVVASPLPAAAVIVDSDTESIVGSVVEALVESVVSSITADACVIFPSSPLRSVTPPAVEPSTELAKPSKSTGKRKRRSRKKEYSFPVRREFEATIKYLDPVVAQDLDTLRDDLQEAIERVVRVEGAFVRALSIHAVQSQRIRHILQLIGEVPFHCDIQRKIVADRVTQILESKAANARRARKEAEEAELERKRQRIADCTSCYFSTV